MTTNAEASEENQPKGPRALSPTDDDLQRFVEGTHDDLASFLGAHVDGDNRDTPAGTTFRVWAPNARQISVIGDFNGWAPGRHPMEPSDSGIWSTRIDEAQVGHRYKYQLVDYTGATVDKADPVAFATEEPPRTSSVIGDLTYSWGDQEWMSTRSEHNGHDRPMAIYELHLGSWRYEPDGYRGLARQLADYLDETQFTHVELLPVMEHPYYGSWGYQTTGYFAPSARYGKPTDLMYLIDLLHQRGYGVILDWVPSHFPEDQHGLARFDGTHLYEHADPRLGFHPDWKSAIFNYDRGSVRSFLLSSAQFWLSHYHADGIRVDAVASMLYRDYSRNDGEWIPNQHGGNENLGAIDFLQELNRRIYSRHPDVVMVAEESTAWPGVSRPTDGGGLGFGFKWDMGWMNDTLHYVALDPLARSHHHNSLTFRAMYAYSENYVLPLSHDEVVHGKGSLLQRQPGDRKQKLAGLRLLYGYQYGLPGKKLLFMGSELAVETEWNHEQELPWSLLQDADHKGVQLWVAALNRLHREQRALHELDTDPAGFQWLIGDDNANSVFAFVRWAADPQPSPESESEADSESQSDSDSETDLDSESDPDSPSDPDSESDSDEMIPVEPVVVVCNFTPVAREGYTVGVPVSGDWQILANSDAEEFGGSGADCGDLSTVEEAAHGMEQALAIDIPPMSALFLAPAGD